MSSNMLYAKIIGITICMEKFLRLEKNIFPATPQRVGIDSNEIPTCGGNFASYGHASAYGAERQQTFPVKGVWIPENNVTCIAYDYADIPPAFQKEKEPGRLFLFLIHPESETLYAPLLEQYSSTITHYPAISLSSVRSLLVELPGSQNEPVLFFVKLSVNCVIGEIARNLSKKECLSSIANSRILKGKVNNNICFMHDVCAFVPGASSIDRAALISETDSESEEYGMIVREIPPCLQNIESGMELIPFFAIFHDNDLLEMMVSQSKLTATEFIRQYLLIPYARVFVELLFFSHISIESHGQNLLWLVSTRTGLPIQFLYRDMGGVNLLLTAQNKAQLPLAWQDDQWFYQDTHLKDAVETLESHWVGAVCFNLTKRLLRAEKLKENDPELIAWAKTMQNKGSLCNWMLEGGAEKKYRHQEVMPEALYQRYGYVENLFKTILIEEIERRSILVAMADKYNYISSLVAGYKDPVTDQARKWFDPFLSTVYSHWLAYNEKPKSPA